ncbi:MAG: type I methionyl aminopeptidase [candidate division Zixibacteria bacterium]|nr:type I methionyl aminopeptidase [candidate division Zixibacteria bacterium]
MINIKSPREIEIIRNNGKLVAGALQLVKESVKPGVTTLNLDKIVKTFVEKNGAKCAFFGYRGYPANICVSIDEEVVHGIPGPRVLAPGQIVSVDVGVFKDGYYADGAESFKVDGASAEVDQLMKVTQSALEIGLAQAKPGNHVGHISNAIQSHVESQGFSVVRDLVGHGVGKEMHEEPQIPNYGQPNSGPVLKQGMVLAIEPMVNAGGYKVTTKLDGWTIVTADGSISAHFEHTVAVSVDGPLILTSLN